MDLWYQQLKKPFWAPSEKLFGPVWSILYVGIIITFATAVYLFAKSQISLLTLLPFILNMMFNLAVTPLQLNWNPRFQFANLTSDSAYSLQD